jgi:hypothetical protein
MVGGGSSPNQKYILPGNSPSFPPSNVYNGMAVSSVKRKDYYIQQKGQSRKKNVGGYSGSDFLNDVERVANIAAPFAPLLMGLGETGGNHVTGGRLARATSVARRVKRGKQTMFEGLPEPQKRKGRLVKGSPEAKQWAQRMREARMRKKTGGAESGGSFLGDMFEKIKPIGRQISNAARSVTRAVEPVASEAFQIAKPFMKQAAKRVVDVGAQRGSDYINSKIDSANHPYLNDAGKALAKRAVDYGTARGASYVKDQIGSGIKKPNQRAQIVKRIMQEKGLKMIEASKYVKQHGLY